MPAGNVTQIIFLVVIVGAFYLLLIRPQQQQAKRQASMLASLEVGTEIMTVGGIYATIVEIEDDRLRVRVADGSEFEIAMRAVGSVVTPAGEDEAETADDNTDDAENHDAPGAGDAIDTGDATDGDAAKASASVDDASTAAKDTAADV